MFKNSIFFIGVVVHFVTPLFLVCAMAPPKTKFSIAQPFQTIALGASTTYSPTPPASPEKTILPSFQPHGNWITLTMNHSNKRITSCPIKTGGCLATCNTAIVISSRIKGHAASTLSSLTCAQLLTRLQITPKNGHHECAELTLRALKAAARQIE
jgi:hypothetical protein